jgi:hypothetical protein
VFDLVTEFHECREAPAAEKRGEIAKDRLRESPRPQYRAIDDRDDVISLGPGAKRWMEAAFGIVVDPDLFRKSRPED